MYSISHCHWKYYCFIKVVHVYQELRLTSVVHKLFKLQQLQHQMSNKAKKKYTTIIPTHFHIFGK